MNTAKQGERSGAWKSLRSKFFSSGVIVLVTIFFLLMLFLPFISIELDEQIKQLERDQRLNVRNEAITLSRLLVFEFSRLQDLIDILQENGIENGYESKITSISNYLWEKVTFNTIIRDIKLLHDGGQILIRPYGADQSSEDRSESDAPQISDYIHITNMSYLSHDDVDYVFMPLYIEGNRWGVVQVAVSTEEIQRQLNDQIARQNDFRQLITYLFLGALVLSSAVGILILSLLARKITEPIKTLARNAERFAEMGDAKSLEKIETENDEVGLLADSFNNMVSEINKLLKEKDDAYVQLKASQDQLRQSEKLATLGQLSGGIAHEINNALSPIRLRSEEVLMTLEEGGSAGSEDLQVILKGIDQCSAIVQKLRDFAAPSLGERMMVDLNHVIRETVALIRRQIEKKNIKLALNLSDIPPINANPGELEQVFMNMLLNARDAVETQTETEGGTILVQTTSEDGSVLVSINDDGIGMDEATQARLFEPFFTTKGVGRGTGLGMSVSFGILQSHGAQITVKSAPDKGTTITVRFPKPPKTEAAGGDNE